MDESLKKEDEIEVKGDSANRMLSREERELWKEVLFHRIKNSAENASEYASEVVTNFRKFFK